MSRPVLVFDMDGVLVDVTESYREAIAQTARYFTGREVSNQHIQDFKNQGGYNDDWKLTHAIIRAAGVEAGFEEVKARFQRLFLGDCTADRRGAAPGTGGTRGSPADQGVRRTSEPLIMRERWVARPGTLEKLNRDFHFAVFTGRPREEALLTLNRFAPEIVFDPIVAMEDVERHKPEPEGLLRILKQHCDCKVFYVGDTVDDARTARAAKVPFIGIAAPSNPLYLDLVFLFQEERAYAIVDDINYLEEVFAS
jgi:HAD superfamily phosphatase